MALQNGGGSWPGQAWGREHPWNCQGLKKRGSPDGYPLTGKSRGCTLLEGLIMSADSQPRASPHSEETGAKVGRSLLCTLQGLYRPRAHTLLTCALLTPHIASQGTHGATWSSPLELS